VTNMPPSLAMAEPTGSPDVAIFGDETSEEVLVAAASETVMRGDADDFVAGAVGTVPGVVSGGEDVAIILLWELASGAIEAQCNAMRIESSSSTIATSLVFP
jgi:hypothetical protein